MVLIPGLLSSFYLLLLHQFWQSTSLLAKEEQTRTAVVTNMAVCFNALVTYAYDIMSLSFADVAALKAREEKDRKTFESSLARVSQVEDGSNNVDVRKKFYRYAQALSGDAEKLSAEMARESYHSNVARFIRYQGLMAKGAGFAEFVKRYYVAETDELNDLRRRLESMRKQLATLADFGVPLVLIGSILALYFFARNIFLNVRSLAAKAADFPNIARSESKKEVLDEFGYLDQVLTRTAEDVRNAAERRQAFVQMLAHDMRSPIMATQINIEIMQEMNVGVLPEAAGRHCASIKQDLSGVHELVSDLLTAEKLECEPIELNSKRISLKKTVEAALASVADLADEKDIAIEYDYVDTELHADAERLLQSIACFFKVAVQAAPRGGVISTSTGFAPGQVTLTFKGEGQLLGDEEMAALYDPFRSREQAATPGSIIEGLNLRVARLLIEAHGGKAGGKCTSDKQREFWLEIPLSGLPVSKSPSVSANSLTSRQTDVSGNRWRDLLSSSSFRNCFLVFSLALVLQSAWIMWLSGRISESQSLAGQTARQSDTVLSLNKLWLEIFLANNAMGFYLATRDQSKVVAARKGLANAEAMLGSVNQLFQDVGKHFDAWVKVMSFVVEELSALREMEQQSEDERAALDLGILGSRIGQAGELNSHMQDLSNLEQETLASMYEQQAKMRARFESVMLLAFISNMLTIVVIVWLFSSGTSKRLDLVVQVAKKIPERKPIEQMLVGNDEIYQVYWHLCRAALNLKDAADQRKVIMQMLAENIGKPLWRVEQDLVALRSLLPADIGKKSLSSLDSASDNTKRLLALVEDLLLLDELECGTLKIEKQPCSARHLVDSSINSVGGLAHKKNIKIKNDCSEVEISADSKRLTQVIVNLLSNAIKFSPRDSQIVVEGTVSNEMLQMAVIDEGPGISKEDITRIFSRFYQMEEHKTQGFGLGLSICVLIVRSHGGEITAESEIGKGSKFIITLPIV